MTNARLERSLFVLGLVASLVLAGGVGASRAQAFHVASTFVAPPGAGGGGGLFYVGSPRERGWTCETCHVDAPHRLRLTLDVAPGTILGDPTAPPAPSLLETPAYVPGASYHFDVAMAEPQAELGRAATRSNYNAIVASFLDASDLTAGRISGIAADRFTVTDQAILASSSTQVGVTSWSFDWIAPPAGTGPVTLYLAVVDGNGAGSDATRTLTDPFGDDVVVTRLRFDELPSD